MRIGVLTGGGDCPGLNAVIRAVVLSGAAVHGDEVLGFLDGWRGVLDDRDHGPRPRAVPGHPGTWAAPSSGRRGPTPSPPTAGPTGRWPTLEAHGIDAVVAIGGEDTLGVAYRLGPLGVAGGGGAQDHRQRPVGHRGHLRLRHRRPDRHRGHRPAADHGRVPPPGHRVRGDGAPRRLDRHPCRASPAARPRSWCPRSPSTSTRSARGCSPAPRTGPVLVDRGRLGGCGAGRGPRRRLGPAGHLARRRSTPSATPAWAGSGPGWPRRSSGGPATSPGSPPSATSSGAAPRPPSTGCWPPASGWRRWPRSTTGDFGTMVALQAGRIVRVPLADAPSAGPRPSTWPAHRRGRALFG